MKEQLYTKEGKPFTGNTVRRLDGKWQLNIQALSPDELAKTCELYTYTPTTPGVNQKQDKMVFDKKTGTCTHSTRSVTPEEIEEQVNQNLMAEFEFEQEEEKRVKFEDWKAKKEKAKLN